MINTSTNDEIKNTKSNKKRTIIITSAIAAVLIAGSGIWWGVSAYHNHQLVQAQEQCAQASDKLRVASNEYNTYLEGDAAKAREITDKQVDDATVITTLSTQYDADKPKLAACNMDTIDELEERTTTITTNADWYETHLADLKTATTAVMDAKNAKELQNAKTAFDKKLADAQKLYDSSKDKVADNKTRDELKKAIDAANKVKDSQTVKDLTDATSSLSKNVDAVNASVKKKQEADKKAAEEKAAAEAAAAAQAQAQAQTPAYTPSYNYDNTQSYTPTYTAPQQSYTPTYTAPAKPSTPSTPNTSGGSSSSGIDHSASGHYGCTTDCGVDDGINHNGF